MNDFYEKAIRLVRAVRKMVNDNTVPETVIGESFPYARELLKWILNRERSVGDIDIPLPSGPYVINLGPNCGEDLIGEIATHLSEALDVLGIADIDIPEYKEFDECD